MNPRPALLPLLALLALLGCGEAPPPGSGKDAVITGHASAATGDFARAAFPCCADPATTAAVAGTIALGARLAADDAAGSAAAAAALQPLIAAAPAVAAAGAPLDALRAAASLEAQQGAFVAVAAPVLAAARAGGPGPLQVAEVLCPMKPGSWLQDGEPVANPFYGAKMLTCGSFVAGAASP
jgi:hypothetical protein